MRRRHFLGTSAALGGLGLLAACAPGSDGGGSDASGIGQALTDLRAEITRTLHG